MGFRSLIIESDARAVICNLNSTSGDLSEISAFICEATELSKWFLVCRFTYLARSGNWAMHTVAQEDLLEIWNIHIRVLFVVNSAEDAQLTPLLRLGAGACAGIIAMSATYPMDMVRGRLIVQFLVVLLHEQLIQGLASFSHWSCELFAEDSELSVTTRLACRATAGTVGQTVTYPLDVIRRRMQMVGWKDAASVVTGDGRNKAPLEYTGMIDAFRKTVRHEGFGALYKGLVPNSVKIWVRGPKLEAKYLVFTGTAVKAPVMAVALSSMVEVCLCPSNLTNCNHILEPIRNNTMINHTTDHVLRTYAKPE
ncbi:mitochondrial adenine nucleotide transporter ADNT1-like [Gossypium australe]|uniref:Mitochondrial adenine nucleotide transporter ADNT1-like n=1 Tax=Gossypium australe TaxID=47621 RepID=A0A5B6U320_9ROSI|nr:mitochondrial adenine nucleotide transporter ADNT1-like [Gossypium australe]